MSPRAVQKRLQFVHIIWLIFVVVAAWIGFQRGVTPVILAIGIAIAALPAVLGLLLIGTRRPPSGLAKALTVVSWTVLGVVSLASTGAGLSPLAVLLVIAPLVALLLGDVRMAAEASIFGCIAYFATALLGQLGVLPAAGGALTPLMSAATLAVLMTAAGLLGTLVKGIQAMQSAYVAPAAKPAEPRVPAGSAVAELPEGCGLLVVHVSPEGRLRGATGDSFDLDRIVPGAALSDLFMPGEDLASLPPHGETYSGELRLINGRTASFMADIYKGGTRLLLRDQSDTAVKVEEAKAQVKQRTAFFASLGHDLRTPLNAILGYADMMRAEIRGPMPEVYADYPDIIHESGSDLLLMVDDILDLAKADADRHRLEPEPVDVTEVARSVMRQLQNQADRVGVSLELKNEDEVWAEADARAVRQIWQNLISNAIKYSHRDSTVAIDTKIKDDVAMLRVTDTGAGIAAEDLETITQPFAQGSNSRGHKGTGLGLAVVRSFAELHGGEIKLKSTIGKGTDVSVTLPLADPADIVPLEDAAQ